MSTITPILDTLLHQVLGRRADMERFTATRPNAPLLAITRTAAPRDATAELGTQPQRLANAKNAGAARSANADGSARAGGTGAAGGEAAARGQTGTGAAAGSSQLHFSREGQAIATLLSRFSTAPMATSYTRGPLFNGQQAPLAPVLASMLGQQLVNSGVFYESHLLKWVEGKRSLKQLAQEPQAQLNTSRPDSSAAGTPRPPTAAPGAAQTSAKGPSSAPQAGPVAGAPTGAAAPSLAPTSPFGGATTAGEPIHESLLPVVRQQLDVLSSAVFRWEGLAWPDVPMQWEVHEHEQPLPDAAGAEADDSQYSTRLSLELPLLGALEVRITLVANTVQLYAWAGSERGVDALKPQTDALQQRLERVGFDAASVRLITEAPA